LEPLAFAHSLSSQFLGGASDESQLGCHQLACDPVFCETSVVLEIKKPRQRRRTEDPIDLVRVETKGVQPSLEFLDVVTTHHGNPVIQQSFTELITSVDKGPPRVWPDDSINGEAPAALKGGNGLLRGVFKDASGISLCAVAQSTESRLDVPDTLSPVALVEKPHELNRCSSSCQPM
jgi:hypothetical protein